MVLTRFHEQIEIVSSKKRGKKKQVSPREELQEAVSRAQITCHFSW